MFFTLINMSARRLSPLLNRVLVERLVPEVKTKGGILLPEQTQKVQTATVIAVGEGARTPDGKTIKPSVNVGDQVLLPEYGGTKVEVDKKELHIFMDTEILAKWKD